MRTLRKKEICRVVGGMLPPGGGGGGTGGGTGGSGGTGGGSTAPSTSSANFASPPFAPGFTIDQQNVQTSTIIENEGNSSLTGYFLEKNTNDEYSGLTIAGGIDVTQWSNTQLSQLFSGILSSQQLSALEAYSNTAEKAAGIASSGTNAWVQSLGKPNVTLSIQQMQEMNAAVYNYSINTMVGEYNDAENGARQFSQLPEPIATVAADLAIVVGPNWLQEGTKTTFQQEIHAVAADFLNANYSQMAADLNKVTSDPSRFQADSKAISNYLSTHQNLPGSGIYYLNDSGFDNSDYNIANWLDDFFFWEPGLQSGTVTVGNILSASGGRV